MIARDGQRERRVRIEHDRRVGRADLELAAQLALRAFAEQCAAHAIGDPAAAATRTADVDRAHAHAGRFDRGEHGHDRRCGCARAGHHQDVMLRLSHGSPRPG